MFLSILRVFLFAILKMTVKSSLEVQCKSKGDVLLPKFDSKMELSNTAVDDNVTTMYPTVKLFLLVAVVS